MDFNEWLRKHEREAFKRNRGRLDKEHGFTANDHFKAGQQSKQEEINALKAKIEDITKWAEFHIEDYNLSESDSEHDRGWFNAACQVLKKLKGDQK